MNRSDVSELHYITEISNLRSILTYGILSHKLAGQLEHVSIAMLEIQDRRERKAIPGGRPLHEYVNLYFHARNPMLYKRRDLHKSLCILQLDPSILDLPGVIIADGNASSDYTGFRPSPHGLHHVDRELVFAEYWTDNDILIGWHKKRVRCAEVLVPDKVEPEFILGAYVSCEDARIAIKEFELRLNLMIDARLFFR
jgi:hypothetical protein